MTLDPNKNTLEQMKFEETSDGVAVRVAVSGGFAPSRYDEIDVAYPTATTETYTYKLLGETRAVVTITYVDATKEQLVSVVRT